MTPRERRDMPWIVAGLVLTIAIIVGGLIWRPAAEPQLSSDGARNNEIATKRQ